MRSAVVKGVELAFVAAVGAVCLVALGSSGGDSVSAQTTPTSGPNSVASCGTSPLNGRTQGVVDAIVRRLKQAGHPTVPRLTASETCSDVTTADLNAITGPTSLYSGYSNPGLHLSSLGLTQLRAGDFAGLTNLRYLNLDRNALTTLPSGIFSALTNLRRLHMLHNGLTTIPNGAFTGLTNLRILDIQVNEIASLPAGGFSALTQLGTLYLGSNRLTTIQASALTGLTSLSWINLDNNRISSLPSDLFSGSTSLSRAYLGQNQLTSLPDDIFDGLASLILLDLNRNYLTSDGIGFLTSADISGTLQSLNLRHNRLTNDGDGPHSDLPDGAFNRHTALRFLYIGGNRFTELPANAFTGMTGLAYLYLGLTVSTPHEGVGIGGRLTTLPDGILNGLTNLLTFSASGHPLTEVDADLFEGLTSLRTVYLQHTHLETLPATLFEDNSSLLHVRLNDNRLASLPANLFQMHRNISEINLSNNRLTSLPTGIFAGLNGFRFNMYLQGNLLTALPDGVFADITVWSRLHLDNNRFTTIPSTVFTGWNTDLLGRFSPTFLRTITVHDNPMTETEFNTFKALFGSSITVVTASTAPTARTPTTTPEQYASCGTGPLNGRTVRVAYDIMRGAYPGGPDTWDSLPSTSVTPRPAQWPSSLDAWQTAWYHPTPTGPLQPGDPADANRAAKSPDNPAFCSQITANDLLQVQVLALPRLDSNLQPAARYQSLKVGDFAGMTNLRLLRIDILDLPEIPAGIFAGLTNLRELHMDRNLLTTLPANVFDPLTQLRVLDLGENRLTSLPADIFNELGELRTLEIDSNMLEVDDVPVGMFSGLGKLRLLNLRSNTFQGLPANRFSGTELPELRTLLMGTGSEIPTQEVFEGFTRILPSLGILTGALEFVANPTPTPTPSPEPTPTPTPTFNERIGLAFVSRIAPVIRQIWIRADETVGLEFDLYNLQSVRDNALSEIDELGIVWSAGGHGSFSEPTNSAAADGDGAVNDRRVLWRAPSEPGKYLVTAGFARRYVCSGGELECTATVTIEVVRQPSTTPVERTPCSNAVALWPSTLTDASGNTYAVFIPEGGGEFIGDGITVSLSADEAGCDFFAIRAVPLPGPFTASHPGWTTAGNRYRISALTRQGRDPTSYTTSAPLSACLQLPDSLRADISGVALLRELSDGSTQVLGSKVRVSADYGPTICGVVSELPAVVIAASRGIPHAQPTPTAEVTPTTPDTGGSAPSSVAYVLLALVLGILAVAGAVRLVDRANTSTVRP